MIGVILSIIAMVILIKVGVFSLTSFIAGVVIGCTVFAMLIKDED